MITKLIRQGDQYLLPIDRITLDQAGLDADAPLTVGAEGGRLVAAPSNGESRRQELKQILKKIDAEYGDVLKRLAE